jgi:hypothetical protein
MRFQRNGIKNCKDIEVKIQRYRHAPVKAELEKRRRDGPESHCEVLWVLKRIVAEPRNLVRDQGVGGSNPLSPTNNFNTLQNLEQTHEKTSGCSPGSLVSEDASFVGFSLNDVFSTTIMTTELISA